MHLSEAQCSEHATCRPHHDGSVTIANVDRRRSGINVVIAQTSWERIDTIRHLDVKCGIHGVLAIEQMIRKSPGHGTTEPHEKVDAYAACVHLEAFEGYDVWCDGQHVSSGALAAGSVHINDMRHEWRANIRNPFHVVNFCIPQSVLDEMSDEEGISRVEELRCPMSLAQVDAVFTNLARALLPALARPDQVNRLFADHAARAVTAHLIRSYGTSRVHQNGSRGGLARWQERRAKELLQADLARDVSLAELASACRLSCSHFSQAFKQTVGCPPHQWLLQQRVERAKQLILNTKLPLSEIALATGFADQSHFTRVFSQRVKASPAAWRRDQGR
jgi:AraC family transcriptional regulator